MTDPEGDREAGAPASSRSSVPVRRADPRLALVALALLCAVCIAIGFALGRAL